MSVEEREGKLDRHLELVGEWSGGRRTKKNTTPQQQEFRVRLLPLFCAFPSSPSNSRLHRNERREGESGGRREGRDKERAGEGREKTKKSEGGGKGRLRRGGTG